jgi:RNA-splicing ligase RtcB
MEEDRASPPAPTQWQQEIIVVTHQELPSADQAMQVLKRLAQSGMLALPPVALPDLHLKPTLETPSSTATATHDTLILGLTSPSPNCGMAMIATSLGEQDLNDARLDSLFQHLSAALDPDGRTPAIDDTTLDKVLLHGAEAWVKRMEWESQVVDTWAIQDHGRAFSTAQVASDRAEILASVPRGFRQLAQREFGLIGRGNHFLEVQVIDKVLDEPRMNAWGLSRGQVMVMFHADSGHLGAIAGRLFAHRRKNSFRGRIIEWRVKVPYHLLSGGFLRFLPRRLRYFFPYRWAPIEANSSEGQRCLRVLGAAANYAFAGRQAVLETLGRVLGRVWGTVADQPRLVYDAPHNGIWREQVGSQSYWVHRHNAVRVIPPSRLPAANPYADMGHPVLLPGTERTSSYLCASSEGAAGSLHSAGHGSASAVRALGHKLHDPSRFTRVYAYGSSRSTPTHHLDDSGVKAVLQALSDHDIVRPVARLRPVAVLKG